MHGVLLWEARPQGEAFKLKRACKMAKFLGAWAGLKAAFAAGRASHKKACYLRESALCTACFCGKPALGAELLGLSGLAEWRSFGAFSPTQRLRSPRVAPPTKKRVPARIGAMHGVLLWEARPGAKLLGSKRACRKAKFGASEPA
ncbi:hypothetical protein L686_13300 [Stutzerimonas stutzeri MF28]|nr:hypothetical protein L686_13300 [Stutzerimonas stutzeri MF28]